MPAADKRARKKERARAAREAREAAVRRRKRTRQAIIGGAIAALLILAFVLPSALGGNKKTGKTTSPTTTAPRVKLTGLVANPGKAYTATIRTSLGTIVVALDAAHAPKAAGRFVELARGHFYDGLTFHRASKDFVIQGGDPTGTGSGGSGNPPIVGETPADHYPLGALAAAKTGSEPAGTFDCQFFIVTGSQGRTLPNDYARFGSVTSGLDVAKKIESLAPASGDGPPTQKVTIDTVTITES